MIVYCPEVYSHTDTLIKRLYTPCVIHEFISKGQFNTNFEGKKQLITSFSPNSTCLQIVIGLVNKLIYSNCMVSRTAW